MLELKNISLKAGELSLLDKPISCAENSGQTIVFFGRNGAGKTTLLKTIAGHIKNNSGEIIAFKSTLNLTPIERWAKICTYISSKEFMQQSITTYEYLLSARLGYTGGLGLYTKTDHAIVDEWIEKLTLTHLINKDYSLLSDGEKQLVTIARAFIYQSPLILLDEPTSNLDIPNKKIITQLLHSLSKSENKLIIYTTHDYYTSKDFCSSIWFINNNKQFVSGKFSELQSHVEKDFDLGK
jgi:iron complex transport system ATP-binding protein